MQGGADVVSCCRQERQHIDQRFWPENARRRVDPESLIIQYSIVPVTHPQGNEYRVYPVLAQNGNYLCYLVNLVLKITFLYMHHRCSHVSRNSILLPRISMVVLPQSLS